MTFKVQKHQSSKFQLFSKGCKGPRGAKGCQAVIGTGVFFSGPKTRFFFRLEPETRTMGPVSLGVKQKIKPIYFRNHHHLLAAVVHRRLLMMTRPSGPHFQLLPGRRHAQAILLSTQAPSRQYGAPPGVLLHAGQLWPLQWLLVV